MEYSNLFNRFVAIDFNNNSMAYFNRDERDCAAVYMDKVNKQYASGNEIAKYCLDKDTNMDSRLIIAEFIGKSLGLIGNAMKVYIVLSVVCNGYCRSQRQLAKKVVDYYKMDCTYQSVCQAIEELVLRYVIVIESGFNIKVNPKFAVPKEFENAKYLVIELNPNITSAPIVL